MECEATKICSVCGLIKNISSFYGCANGKPGTLTHCKECHGIRVKKWRANNPEKHRESNRLWQEKNIEKARLSVRNSSKKWRENNPEKYKLKNKNDHRKWKEKDPERARVKSTEGSARWRLNNPDKSRIVQNRANKKRRENPKNIVSNRISALIRISLKGNKKNRWINIVDYGPLELETHLKSTIPDGYLWDDFLNGALHIDHIIPISVHNFKITDDNDFKRCWALDNLRLLTAQENLSKGAKLDRPFQPSLF